MFFYCPGLAVCRSLFQLKIFCGKKFSQSMNGSSRTRPSFSAKTMRGLLRSSLGRFSLCSLATNLLLQNQLLSCWNRKVQRVWKTCNTKHASLLGKSVYCLRYENMCSASLRVERLLIWSHLLSHMQELKFWRSISSEKLQKRSRYFGRQSK